MKRFTLLLFLFLSLFQQASGETTNCPIVPRPREFQSTGEIWQFSGASSAILRSADCPYASERLQALIRNRFHIEVPIQDVNEIQTKTALIFATAKLPQNDTADSSQTLPWNGFRIGFTPAGENGPREIRVTGADASGILYGVEALFGLMRKTSDASQVGILAAEVRDWPSIPWRGRPHSVAAHHLIPGQLDAYLHARLNFSDFRDDPDQPETLTMPARKASMGCVPGKPIDRKLFNKVFTEFKRRGMFVYGTVSCQVKGGQYEKVTRTFDELLALGCDGIWLSMDDTGGGSDPTALARYVSDYMQQRGIHGHRMAFTPGAAEYTTIEKPLNRAMAQISPFNDSFWIFTRVPCAADLAHCKELGLKQKPCWWFNYCETAYPDPKAGFIHSSSILTTQRKDGRPSYMNLLPITPGWGTPDFDRIRDAAQFTDQVNLWALCGGWPSEYALVMFGLWAWNPETCDWPTLRDGIYDFVWGPDQVAAIREFDSLYAELKTHYVLPGNWSFRTPDGSLVRLKDPASRPQVLALLDRLDALAARLAKDAPQETALTQERLHDAFIEPMQTSLRFARKQATLEYPEYEFSHFEQELETLAREKGQAAADQRRAEIRTRLNAILTTLSSELNELKDVEPVLEKWRKKIQL